MNAGLPGSTVSVVIPMHNGLPHIADALQSVQWQTQAAHEVIVVDDGSTDGSAEWVQQHYPHVKLLRQQQQGIAATRNRGISAATGDWVAFLDHDDAWHPGKLQVQLQAASRHPDASVVYGDFQRWLPDAEGRHVCPHEWTPPGATDPSLAAEPVCAWSYSDFLLDCWMQTSTAMIRRNTLVQSGAFDPTWPTGEDWDLWLRLCRLTRFVHIPLAVSLYRQHPQQSTRQQLPTVDYRTRLIEQAIRQWGYTNPDGSGAAPAIVRRKLSTYHWEFGASHLAAGHRGTFYPAMAAAISTDPTFHKPYFYGLAALMGWRPKWGKRI
ncbi:glycosyltransferase family 2 protein [Roseateles sp.]|jgi:glycosyltransferase involved in cell wall biosynthesis|uniref:glycosyltransferase family 2 protein n=1 Tax=Roseateles sp. TaxID=1971397 RepID=UPI0037C7A713